MSKTKTSLFQIDGQPMFAPDSDVDMSFNDVDSSDTGRDESGTMHRIVIRYNVGTWSFVYSKITDADLAYMKSLLSGKADFTFVHPVPGDSTKTESCRAYSSKRGIAWHSAVTGEWRNFKFDIIEC